MTTLCGLLFLVSDRLHDDNFTITLRGYRARIAYIDRTIVVIRCSLKQSKYYGKYLRPIRSKANNRILESLSDIKP